MYEEKGVSSTRISVNRSAIENQYKITSLRPTTKYTIYLYASTQKGAGPSTTADVESGVEPGKGSEFRNCFDMCLVLEKLGLKNVSKVVS
ncbi:hypothetical protein DPMN_030001 [Dreissena polymorpha]|uniref:Fibronectin type-III domain-containing protein n=1 Tax=Dreissena polymorpha TaxID=45954 RepID=A0A9D4RGQ9_DREPO|nr:hypothetical protein DPMN_030001 [Dreissena polymorpha]